MFIMAALCNRGPLYFYPGISFYLLSFFFSSPNLSGHRLVVYHTSTHGVALVRIQNTGLKCAARGLAANAGPKKVAKNRHLDTIPQLCRAISSQLSHVSTIDKNLLSSNISSTCPHNMVNFGPLAAEIVSLVWGTPGNLNGFRVLAALSNSGRQPNCGIEQRAPPILDRAAITLGIDPHFQCFMFMFGQLTTCRTKRAELIRCSYYSGQTTQKFGNSTPALTHLRHRRYYNSRSTASHKL